MNDRQRRFAELVVQGRPAGRAYEEAGYDARGKSADEAASALSRTLKVKAYMSELREKAVEASHFTTVDRLNMLERIAKAGEDEDPRVSISAIDQANKMTGGHSPEKIDIKAEIEIVIGS